MRAIVFQEHGGPEVLKAVDLPPPQPGAGQVLLRVRAAGVNYADTMQRAGTYGGQCAFPFTAGFEGCGEVLEVGPGVAGLSVGQRVMGRVKGGYAEYAVAPAAEVLPVPEGATDAEAAAFPIVFQTAWHCLVTVGRTQPGEAVLIHAAGGGVGTAAVQLARLLGARILATAGNDDKLRRVRELGADVTVNYRERPFAEAVRGETGRRGADVILESVGGSVFSDSLECLAPLGRLVVFGVAGGQPSHPKVRQLLAANQGVLGFHLGQLNRSDPEVTRRGFEMVTRFWRWGRVRPVVGHVLPLEQARQAHELMARRDNYGKIVLVPGPAQ
jgi:NADPH:quinone reductase